MTKTICPHGVRGCPHEVSPGHWQYCPACRAPGVRYFPICKTHGEMHWSVAANDLSARCSTCSAPLDAAQPRLVTTPEVPNP